LGTLSPDPYKPPLLPEPLALSLIVFALIAFGSGFIHSLAGFGGALVLAAGLSALVEVKLAVPLTTTAMIVANSGRAWAFRHAIPWRAALGVSAVALPFIIVGALFFIRVSEAAASALVGGYLLCTVPLRRLLAGRGIGVGRRGLAFAAVPYGLISGASFGAGLVLAPFLIGAGILGESLVAVVAVLGLGLNTVKTIIFAGSPLLTGAALLLGIGIGLCTIPGTYAGRWLLRRTPLRLHAAALETLVVIAGVAFLYKALA
jgi:uncharacterized protein